MQVPTEKYKANENVSKRTIYHEMFNPPLVSILNRKTYTFSWHGSSYIQAILIGGEGALCPVFCSGSKNFATDSNKRVANVERCLC